MDKRKFRVIKGKKQDPIDIKYGFIQAYVTNTRLMGVIGLRIMWEADGDIFHQFFHLDSEEYGLDDYSSVIGKDHEQAEMITANMMGGLGGKFVEVNEKEARYLVKSFVQKNKRWRAPLPESQEEYNFLIKKEVDLSEEEKKKLWNKMCETIYSPIQLINYFIMRAVGLDQKGMDYLSDENVKDYKVVRNPSTLLKNTIHKNEEDSYITESIVDAESHYKMVVSEIKVKNKKIVDAEIKSTMRISNIEVAFALNKKEYMLIYNVVDSGKLIKVLDKEKPHAMKNGYELGYLYTEFNPTNDHVKEETYYLKDDIYGLYYITTADQLVVAAYTQDRIKEIVKFLSEGCFGEILEFEEKIELDKSLLYDFIYSDYDNIFDFFNEE